MIVGICGRKRAGKDTVGSMMIRYLGGRKRSLADPMKEVASIMFGWDAERIEQHKEETDPKWGISPRQFLQVFGTEFAQHMLSDMFPSYKAITGRKLWVNNLIDNASKDNYYVFVCDVRFLHEAEAIRQQKGSMIIKVIRPGYFCEDSHSSEQDIDKIEYDHLIVNDGTLDDLNVKVSDLVFDKFPELNYISDIMEVNNGI